MEIPPLIKIGSDPIWLFGLFGAFLLFFHVWLVYWKPIGNIGWKRVDYIWLGVAVIGLVGQSAQVRQHWYATTYGISHYRVDGALKELKQRADFSIGAAICRPFVKSEYSPKNFDQIQAEYKFACIEFAKITKEVRSAGTNRDVGFLDLLDTSQIRNKLTDSILIETLSDLESAHHRFIDALKERNDAKYKTQTTSGEFVLIIFSPFLFMFALALRIAKVTGEIRLPANSSFKRDA